MSDVRLGNLELDIGLAVSALPDCGARDQVIDYIGRLVSRHQSLQSQLSACQSALEKREGVCVWSRIDPHDEIWFNPGCGGSEAAYLQGDHCPYCGHKIALPSPPEEAKP